MSEQRPTWREYFKKLVQVTSERSPVIDYKLVVFLLKIIVL